MSKFIPIYEYAKKHNVGIQNVYRWIREHKFKEEDISSEVVSNKRLRIREDAKI